MTREEWDAEFMRLFDRRWIDSSSKSASRVINETREEMLARYGPRPEGVPGPPWWLKLGALPTGVNMSKIWAWFNGKKLVIGALITIIASIAGALPVLLAAVGVDAVVIAKVVGVATMVVGLLHKFYKWMYKEEHP